MASDASAGMFETIEQLLSKFCTSGDTVLLGDVNARTSNLDDIIDESDSNSLNDSNVIIPERQNCDRVVNKYGKMLCELSQTTQHLILNGRFLGDLLGYYTFMSTNGCSAVDYIITNNELYKCVDYFNVSPASHLSDHCMVEACFSFESLPTDTHTSSDDNVLHPLFSRFKGGRDYRDRYSMSVLSDVSQNSMCKFLTDSYSDNLQGVNQAAQDFTHILVEAGKNTFPLKKS